MNRKAVAGLLGVLVAAAAIAYVFITLRHHDVPEQKASAPVRDGKVDDPWAKSAASKEPGKLPRGLAPQWELDIDPEGPLRLEGQVVDADGHGVGGAEVLLGSVPPRTAKTEDDGSFSFDKLVGRTYGVIARNGELLAGPVEYKLTEKSDPLVLKLAAGAKLTITVTEDNKHPLKGATITLVGEHDRKVQTGEDGNALLSPVHPGWVAVQVSAPNHATANAFTSVASAGATGHLDVVLHKGVAVQGHVRDESGKPIARARVTTTGMWDIPGAIEPVRSDDSGAFTIAALAAGSHTLIATDGNHAPARSSPITVGDRPVDNVEIVMKAGGTISGRVVDSERKPVAFATLRVAGKGQEMSLVQSRQTTSDRKGAFELHGLSRAKLQVRAESDEAASKLVDIDLTTQTTAKDLEIILDVRGTISGVVVDDGGQPVAEVQVNAFPDITSSSIEGLQLAGMSSTTTGGDGAFTIRGVPDGAYRVSAARTTGGRRDFGLQGVPAKTGDKNVKIVLASPGVLTATLVIDGGTTPKTAFVRLGYQGSTPVSDGKVRVEDLAPGNYDVDFFGPDFAMTIKHDVAITAGKTTDLGTVTVMRGRKLTGRVIDASGTPVAGAKVKVGDMLMSIQGAEEQLDNIEQSQGTRVAVTDQDGAFTLIGIPKKRTSAIADHPDRGRSSAAEIAEGDTDPAPVTLQLRGFGTIVGKVTLKGAAASGVTITDTPKGGGAQLQIAQADDTGAFTISKAAEGTHVLSAMQQSGLGMSFKSTSTTVQVTAGKTTTVAIDIPVGSIALTVQLKAQPGAKLDAAQVFLFHGSVMIGNAKELTQRFLGGDTSGMKIWFGEGKPMPEFDELVPGDYSACSIPVTGNVMDPALQQRIQEHMDMLKVYCMPVTVAPSPDKQTITQTLPAMVTLPVEKS